MTYNQERWDNEKNTITIDPGLDDYEEEIIAVNGLGTGASGNVIGFAEPR
jgi:hypothetical protein